MSTSFPIRISKKTAPGIPTAVSGLAYREPSILSLPTASPPQRSTGLTPAKQSVSRTQSHRAVATKPKQQEDQEEESSEPLLSSVPPPPPDRTTRPSAYKSQTLPTSNSCGTSGRRCRNNFDQTPDYSLLNLYATPHAIIRERGADSSSRSRECSSNEENFSRTMNSLGGGNGGMGGGGGGGGCGGGPTGQSHGARHNESIFMRNCSERNSAGSARYQKMIPITTIDKLKEIPKYPLDPNNYATRKTVAQGMMVIALMTANASQMKYVLLSGDQHRFFSVTVALITVSIILEVIAGIMMIYLAKWNVNYAGHQKRADVINNFVIITIFLITVVNVLISAFGPVNAGLGAAAGGPHDPAASSSSWNVYPPTFKLDEPLAPVASPSSTAT